MSLFHAHVGIRWTTPNFSLPLPFAALHGPELARAATLRELLEHYDDFNEMTTYEPVDLAQLEKNVRTLTGSMCHAAQVEMLSVSIYRVGKNWYWRDAPNTQSQPFASRYEAAMDWLQQRLPWG